MPTVSPRRSRTRAARSGAALGALTLAAVLGTTAGCREPTKITVEITTDVPCNEAHGATVTVGQPGQIEAKAVTATSGACDPATGRVGSVVIVPSGGDGDEVGIKAVLGVNRPPASCTPPYGPGCVVARRALHFIPHTPLVVPIHMEQVCDGVACDPSTTCVHGQCVPAEIPDPAVCEGQGCGEGLLYPDAGVRDATVGDGPSGDATIDATTLDAGDGAVADAALDGGTDATVTACGDMGGLAANAQWPMIGYCSTRISRSPFVGPQSPQLRWSIPVTYGYSATIGADGTVYFVDNTTLRAVAPDGGGGWSASSGPAVSWNAPLLASDGNLYVGGAYDSNVYVFSPDGGVLRSIPTGTDAGVIWIDSRDTSGTLYFRGGNPAGPMSVNAYDVTGQRLLYSVPVGNLGASGCTVAADGTLYVGSGDGFFRALAPSTGAVRWAFDAGSMLAGAVSSGALSGDRVVFNTYTGTVALAPDGGVAWSAPLLVTGQSSAAVGANGTVYAGTSDGLMVALDPVGGAQAWAATVTDASPAYVTCTPVVDALGTIYVGTDYGGVHALRSDGGDLWSFDAGGPVRDFLALGSGVLVFHTNDPDGGMRLVAIGP